MGNRIDEGGDHSSKATRADRAGLRDSAAADGVESAETAETAGPKVPDDVGEAAESSSRQMRRLTGTDADRADGYEASGSWRRVARSLDRVDSLDQLTDRAIHQLAGFENMGAVALRQLVADRSSFRTAVEDTLALEVEPTADAAEVEEVADRVVQQATIAFGDRVSEVIGHRVRERLRGIEIAPEMINASPTSRRAFLRELAETTDGEGHGVRVALAKLNIHGERADRIVAAVEAACKRGEIDELGDPDMAGPDVIVGWSDGQYQNAADDLQAGLDETLESIESLRSQLGHRDMATPESANLVNPNISGTRQEVLDALEVGDITDDAISEAGGGAELALTEYRDKLVSDDTWTEKLGGVLETTTFGVADYFTGGAASGAQDGMELFVAWHEANMADFASRHADTADPSVGAQRWRDVGQLATETAVEVVAGQLLDGLPTPREAPEHADVVIDELKRRAATRIGEGAGEYTAGRVDDVAGETNVVP